MNEQWNQHSDTSEGKGSSAVAEEPSGEPSASHTHGEYQGSEGSNQGWQNSDQWEWHSSQNCPSAWSDNTHNNACGKGRKGDQWEEISPPSAWSHDPPNKAWYNSAKNETWSQWGYDASNPQHQAWTKRGPYASTRPAEYTSRPCADMGGPNAPPLPYNHPWDHLRDGW